MQVYTTEFMRFIEKTEVHLGEKYYNLGNSYGEDSMIELRNLSIGDSNQFGKNKSVYVSTNSIDVSAEIYFLSRKSEDEVVDMIWSTLKKDISEKIENKIQESNVEVVNLKDVRKIVKVVIDTDILINHHNYTLSYRLGVEVYKGEMVNG